MKILGYFELVFTTTWVSLRSNHRLHGQVRTYVETQLQSEGQEGGNSDAILCQRIDALSQVSKHDNQRSYTPRNLITGYK